MHKKRNGIIAAGNWIMDHVKVIDNYPIQDSLANITGEYYGNGGSPYNVLKNISKLGALFPLKGIGLIGDDGYGHQIRKDCSESGIDTTLINTIHGVSTSYTDVMTVEDSGRRTFFHQRGANSFLDGTYFDFSPSKEKLFHLGYLLLLDGLDKIDDDGNTEAGKVLKKACKAGLRTSVDLVSEDSHRFKKVVLPALQYVDYLFLNEFEASRCVGVSLKSDAPEYSVLNHLATTILDEGVRKWVFIHFPKGVFAKSKEGQIIHQASIDLPKNMIKGVTGAGDALAAGILYALHEEWEVSDAIRLGICAAASCLLELGCSDGILTYKKCLKLGNAYGKDYKIKGKR